VEDNGDSSMDIDDGAAAARREQIEIDAALVERARADEPDAFGELYERWFERVYDLAYRISRDSDTAAEVAQDAFPSAWRQLGKLQDANAFGGWLLRITRNAAFNRQRKDRRSAPRDAEGMAMIEDDGPRADAPAGFRVEDRAGTLTDPARVAEDHEVADLVWESAEALGAKDTEVLDLTLRHGLTPAEVGEVIGVNRNAANQTVHRVRTRLRAAVEARVLWRSGEPVCGDLADALTAAGVTRFDGDAVRVTSEHVETCEQCANRRKLKLEPSAMFAATPFIAAPLIKAKVAHALSNEGVPVGPSASARIGGSDDAPDEAELTDQPRGHGTRGRIAAGVGALVLVLVGTIALAEDIDETGGRAHLTPREGAELARSTSTTTPPLPTTPISEGPATTRAPRVAAPPAPPQPEVLLPPPPPPPPVTGGISISPAASSSPIFLNPVLSWNTVNAVSVQVSGPGISSSQPNGSAPVCPGTPTIPAECMAPNGSYTYTVRATDTAGALVFERSVTFTVG
jgi:RNA polymerase sigma factor (sigma-70 family)